MTGLDAVCPSLSTPKEGRCLDDNPVRTKLRHFGGSVTILGYRHALCSAFNSASPCGAEFGLHDLTKTPASAHANGLPVTAEIFTGILCTAVDSKIMRIM